MGSVPIFEIASVILFTPQKRTTIIHTIAIAIVKLNAGVNGLMFLHDR